MNKTLKKLIEKAEKKLEAAKDARAEVMDYLEERYGVDTTAEYEYLEDECSWCYGIDTEKVEKLIAAAKKAKKTK